jgi:hypothetical protein
MPAMQPARFELQERQEANGICLKLTGELDRLDAPTRACLSTTRVGAGNGYRQGRSF